MKNQSAHVFILLALSAYAVTATCQDGKDTRTEDSPRQGKPPQSTLETQLGLNQSALTDLETEEQDLRLEISELEQILTDAEKEKFKDARLAWIKYRDQQCKFVEIFYSGGSIANLQTLVCKRDLTHQFLLELRKLRNP